MKEYTYFIQSEDGGNIKIGSSRNPSARLSSLQTGSPVKLRLVGVIEKPIERELHSKFSEHRTHGEWFSPVKEILDFIKDECKDEYSKYVSDNVLKLKENKVDYNITNVIKSFNINVSNNAALSFPYSFDIFECPEIMEEIESIGCFERKDFDIDDEDIEVEDRRSVEQEIEDRIVYSECEYDVVDKIFNYIDDSNGEKSYFNRSNNFFTNVCIDPDNGYFCIVCKSCTSSNRKRMVQELSDIVDEMDAFTGGWNFFIIFEGQPEKGLDLFYYNMYLRNKNIESLNDDFFMFDVSKLIKKEDLCV
jgi:hypothetical protein